MAGESTEAVSVRNQESSIIDQTFRRLWKPWFVWRPGQLVRRALERPLPPGFQWLRLAWGESILADPAKTIGFSIRTTGIHDIAASEALVRLVRPGDTVIDVGANVGYMTLLAAAAVGPAGLVTAFEPHPELFELLTRNVQEPSIGVRGGEVRAHRMALGAEEGTAWLLSPSEMATNDGVSFVSHSPDDGQAGHEVMVTTLDQVLGAGSAGLLKIDVEGSEIAVLRGGLAALAEGRIRHVLYEDHVGPTSEVTELLRSLGFTIFAVGWTVGGLKLRPAGEGSIAESYEAPSYIATRTPDEVRRQCARRGWRVLTRGLRGR